MNTELLEAVGFKVVYVKNLRITAAVVCNAGVVLIREGLPEELQSRVADEALADAVQYLHDA